jgi:hypothetical protein
MRPFYFDFSALAKVGVKEEATGIGEYILKSTMFKQGWVSMLGLFETVSNLV